MLEIRSDNWMTKDYLHFLMDMKLGINHNGNSLRFMTIYFYENNDPIETLIGYDIGYIYNWIYTSLTGGFDDKIKNGGHITLIMLFFYLKKLGIEFWDLGMSIDYKKNFMAKPKTW